MDCCFFRLLRCVNSLLHWMQGYLTFLRTDLIWIFRFPIDAALSLHRFQGYLTFSWTDLICFFRYPCVVALYSHILHGSLIFLWTDSKWVFRFSYVLAWCWHCIEYKETKFLYVLYEYVSLEHCSICNFRYKLRTNYLNNEFYHQNRPCHPPRNILGYPLYKKFLAIFDSQEPFCDIYSIAWLSTHTLLTQEMKKFALTFMKVIVMLSPSSPACTGRDPYFTAKPQIEQVGLLNSWKYK